MDPKTGKPFQKEGLTPSSARNPWTLLLTAGLGLFLLLASLSPTNLREVYSAPARYPIGELSSPLFVKRVIDGDTIELATGVRVRYIGVDAPELRRKVGDRWVVVNEPYAREAYEFNRRLVEDQWVRLERDREDRDRHGRRLAYVYTGTGSKEPMRFVNGELLKAGLARVLVHPPNLRYAALFRGWEREARENRRGLWQQARPSSEQGEREGEAPSGFIEKGTKLSRTH